MNVKFDNKKIILIENIQIIIHDNCEKVNKLRFKFV